MSVSLRWMPSLSSGKRNSGIELVTVDGRVWVRRLYDLCIVDKLVMRWQLAVAADAGLVRDPEWLIEVVPEGTWKSNPHQKILQLDDVPKTVLWESYGDFLGWLKECAGSTGPLYQTRTAQTLCYAPMKTTLLVCT
jgi:hypothetical protein